ECGQWPQKYREEVHLARAMTAYYLVCVNCGKQTLVEHRTDKCEFCQKSPFRKEVIVVGDTTRSTIRTIRRDDMVDEQGPVFDEPESISEPATSSQVKQKRTYKKRVGLKVAAKQSTEVDRDEYNRLLGYRQAIREIFGIDKISGGG
ncbi:MAG: hypothetical protein KJ604_20615, partial [Gammaproteobacteria bacterium]|nr:hypothetical protein [Gammaproteobacteria bacterium]